MKTEKMIKKILIHVSISALTLVPTVSLLAQTVNQPTPPTTINIDIPNPASSAGSDLISLIKTLFDNVVMPIAAVAVVLWIVYAGFLFLTAQGKEAEIRKAKENLLWSLIGAGILLGAAGISAVVEKTINDVLG